ncbi:L-2-amino-thiazoline-4-carboxylic acid hydrolase [Sulfitobacter sp.]|uniref:L-2-amino-thiazoline-4-carboxylic acid hydrolase n=1 Tax=Sulfitobacter sp. TaxID=1903071 RepID=UPI0025E3286E|nr:L-2-amino-thiazoline-4-carboxylic acid hydrolase [Sulfitobacter sp.]
MTHGQRLFRVLFRPVVRAAAMRAILGRNRVRGEMAKGRFTRAEIHALLTDTWTRFEKHAAEIPHERSAGARLWLLNGALIISAIQSAIDRGVERAYAIELVGDAAWIIYRRFMAVPDAVVRLTTRDPAKRLERDTHLIMDVFPFGPKSYCKRWIDSDRGGVFLVTRCPYQELHHKLLSPEDARDFCQGTACNLDYPLAEMWGGQLERSQTLVSGGRYCDFRYVRADRMNLKETKCP